MSGTAVQQYYRKQASIYDATRWMFLLRRRRAVQLLRLTPESHALEIGCGTGLNFPLLQRELSPDAGSLTGLDFSSDMLRRAAQRVARAGWTNVQLVEADAGDFDLHRTFDAIFVCYALSMMPRWRETIRLAREHLRPAGRLVVHDFDDFARWGPVGSAVRWVQRRNHVDTDRPIEAALRETFGNVEFDRQLGGYLYTAVAAKRA